jgi:ribose-phosphate pyrophosphokinase
LIEKWRVEMIVIPGPASRELGEKVAGLTNSRKISIDFKRFPDGESYIRFEDNVEDKDVVIIQSTGPPQDSNLIQLFLMLDTVREMKAKSIVAVIPYFAYSRQDKRFLTGEAFSFKTISSILEYLGVKKVITINFHNPNIIEDYSFVLEDLSAVNLLASHIEKEGLKGSFSLSLGKKGLNMAKQASNILGGDYGYIRTMRDRKTGLVEIEGDTFHLENKNVVLFDDIISSGGTMVEAVKSIKELGAKKIYIACVHPILIGKAKEKIMKLGVEKIIGTDSISSSVSIVSVAPLIANALKNNFQQK